MAHVGQKYKLQFRRDLAFDVSNVNAYPEAMLFKEDNLDGGVGRDIDRAPVLLVNLAKDNPPIMKWKSAVRSAAGITYTMTFIMHDPTDRDHQKVEMQVMDAVTGIMLLNWTVQPVAFARAPANMSSDGGVVLTQTPLCFIPSGAPSWEYFAAGWSDYNP
jgi:hypothetical protein